MRTPVIVVGAGAGGLVAALYLQRAGHDVALFEAQAHVGGCASAFSAKGFRFLAGATTLMGLEPEFPLGRVLRELDVPFTAPTAARNLTAWQAGEALTLLPDARANEVVLTERYGASFGRFWTRAATLGARGWEAVTELRFPPRGPGDLLATAGSRRAWGLVPALLRSTATAMGAQPARAKELLDELLLVSTQAKADAVPYLFGALGIEYLQRPLYLATGGLAALPERLAEVFVQRGGVLRTGTPVTAWTKGGAGFRVETPAGAFACAKLVLDLTHWDAERRPAPRCAAPSRAPCGDTPTRGRRARCRWAWRTCSAPTPRRTTRCCSTSRCARPARARSSSRCHAPTTRRWRPQASAR